MSELPDPLRTLRSPTLQSEIGVGVLFRDRLAGTRDPAVSVPRPLAERVGRCAQPGPSSPALPESQ